MKKFRIIALMLCAVLMTGMLVVVCMTVRKHNTPTS